MAASIAHLRHLARRLRGMLSSEPVAPSGLRWVEDHLGTRELDLWRQLSPADQRHSVDVARRLTERAPGARREAVAAALLHDIGKLDSGLGVLMRVVATIVGPRTPRLRRYHDHERIGAAMLVAIDADPETVALVAGTSSDQAMLSALHAADDI